MRSLYITISLRGSCPLRIQRYLDLLIIAKFFVKKIYIVMDINSVQSFIMDRVLEALNKATLDSYRVRINNTYTSLRETRDIIQRSGEMKVKTFETVKLLASETIDLLRTDTCLQFESYSRELLISEIEDFLRQNADKLPNKIPSVDRVLFCLNKCIDENQSQYLACLFKRLDVLLAECSDHSDEDMLEYLGKIDDTVSSLCVQLIFEGFSKRYLYTELKFQSGRSFVEFHNALKEFGKKRPHQYEIIWKIRLADSTDDEIKTIGFKLEPDIDHVNEIARAKYKKLLAPGKSYCFFQDSVKALDMYSAARLSREKLMQRFDGIHLGFYSKMLQMPETALALEKRNKGWFAIHCKADYFLDGSFAEDYTLSAGLISSIETIYASNSVGSPVKDRIKSAIRHLNYGDLDSEIEQRFINYWIALEFIFASPHTSENTYTRLKSHLVDILAVSYVGRNVGYLKDKLVEAGFINETDEIWKDISSLDAIANRADIPLFWKYKLKKMKSRLFIHTDKLKKYYNNHITNLERHIARIYNLRNVLIHEGAIKQDVEDLASNLRYYLVFLLDQMMSYFGSKAIIKGKTVQLEDFFNEYRSYKKYIEANFKLESLLSIPINKTLW